MCSIKTGERVESRVDLQNLVTSTFLRQQGAFTIEDLEESLKKDLDGSAVYHLLNLSTDKSIVKEVFDNTLETLKMADCLRFKNGAYFLTLSFPSFS